MTFPCKDCVAFPACNAQFNCNIKPHKSLYSRAYELLIKCSILKKHFKQTIPNYNQSYKDDSTQVYTVILNRILTFYIKYKV